MAGLCGMANAWSDNDPVETSEWLGALASLVKYEGKERAEYILQRLLEQAKQLGLTEAAARVTAYQNTIPVADQPEYPGDRALEAMVEALIRWNAIAMVIKAKQD